MSDAAAPRELRRQLGLASATAVLVGEIIAIGIFLTPAGMAKSLGAPLWILLVWLVMGAMALSGALCSLTVVSVLTRRRSRPDAEAARIPLYPLPPLVFLALVALLSALLVAGRPKESLLGLAVVALSLPVYAVVGSRTR